jgi:GNAT superfamily N-acetyltransferase
MRRTLRPATPILTDLSPAALAAAGKDNLNAFNRHLRHSAATDWYEEGGLFIWRTPIPHEYYNGVVCMEPAGADADAAARAAVEFFQARDAAAFIWWLAPQIEALQWSPRLLAHGFVRARRIPGMAADLAQLSASERPAPVEIRRVLDQETLRAWARTFAAGFGVSGEWADTMYSVYRDLLGTEAPMRCYLAYRAGKPVATSTVFLGAGVAGIYDVTTVPSARRQGIGFSVTRTPLLEARDLGYRAATLQASSMGLPVYERMGFRTVCRMDHFLWRAEGSRDPASV